MKVIDFINTGQLKSVKTLPTVAINRLMETAHPGTHTPDNSSATLDFQVEEDPLSMEMDDSSNQHIDTDPLDLEM